MEFTKQNELTKWRQTDGYREQTDSCQRGGDMGEKGEVIKQRKKKRKTHAHRQQYGDCQKEG